MKNSISCMIMLIFGALAHAADVEEKIEPYLVMMAAGEGLSLKIARRGGEAPDALDWNLRSLKGDPYHFLRLCREQARDVRSLEDHRQASAKNPIYLLSECTQPLCTMVRGDREEQCPRRKAIEILQEEIFPKLKKSARPITVTSYASGFLYYDLEVMQKLKDEGLPLRRLILIEPLYTDFVQSVLKQIGDSNDERTFTVQDDLYACRFADRALVIFQFLNAVDHLFPGVELIIFLDKDDYSSKFDASDLIYAYDHVAFLGLEKARANLEKLKHQNLSDDVGHLVSFEHLIFIGEPALVGHIARNRTDALVERDVCKKGLPAPPSCTLF